LLFQKELIIISLVRNRSYAAVLRVEKQILPHNELLLEKNCKNLGAVEAKARAPAFALLLSLQKKIRPIMPVTGKSLLITGFLVKFVPINRQYQKKSGIVDQ